MNNLFLLCIEGIPFIIRFKTSQLRILHLDNHSIEGIPFIIRFKTTLFSAKKNK